jgi:hypothetical protein
VDTRIERVVLQTPGQQIEGDLTLPKDGYRSRLSDFLNRGDVSFIPLVNVEIVAANGEGDGEPIHRSFIAVARDHVQLAYPAQDN